MQQARATREAGTILALDRILFLEVRCHKFIVGLVFLLDSFYLSQYHLKRHRLDTLSFYCLMISGVCTEMIK